MCIPIKSSFLELWLAASLLSPSFLLCELNHLGHAEVHQRSEARRTISDVSPTVDHRPTAPALGAVRAGLRSLQKFLHVASPYETREWGMSSKKSTIGRNTSTSHKESTLRFSYGLACRVMCQLTGLHRRRPPPPSPTSARSRHGPCWISFQSTNRHQPATHNRKSESMLYFSCLLETWCGVTMCRPQTSP